VSSRIEGTNDMQTPETTSEDDEIPTFVDESGAAPDPLEEPPDWIDDSDTEENACEFTPSADIPSSLRLLFVFLLMWQYLFHVSDAGIAILIVFLHNFLRLLSSLSQSEFLNRIAAACPTSLYSTRKILGVRDDCFRQYVVCPKCNSIYELEQCIGTTARGSKYTKHCWYVEFPNHPRQQLRTECGMPLLDAVCSRSGNISFRPKNVFCYQPLKESITRLFHQKDFITIVERAKCT
jgi:hypothetical protein